MAGREWKSFNDQLEKYKLEQLLSHASWKKVNLYKHVILNMQYSYPQLIAYEITQLNTFAHSVKNNITHYNSLVTVLYIVIIPYTLVLDNITRFIYVTDKILCTKIWDGN